MPSEIMNTTGYNAISSISSTWTAILISVAVFVGVFLTIFLISKNFRQLIYGSVISTILLLNYKFSTYVGISTAEGNTYIIKRIIYVFVFIVFSIIAGRLSQKLKFVQKLEDKLRGDKNGRLG